MYRIQRTEPAFCAGHPDLRWHVLNERSEIVRFTRTKREAQEWITAQAAK